MCIRVSGRSDFTHLQQDISFLLLHYLWVRGPSGPHQARCREAASASHFHRATVHKEQAFGRRAFLAASGGSGSEDPRTQSAASSLQVSAARKQR